MLRKKLESESGTESADSGFFLIYGKNGGFQIRIAIPGTNIPLFVIYASNHFFHQK